ncbi:MAG: Nif3-like dinuclear metal center hexameric protein [Lachnospiraceae bacterium]|nr:Nif3-like dinuclear metal center hexameric protein [Lachnospiraceae bacterium]
MKIQDIINRIIAYHPPFKGESSTDVVKYGNPDQECTGIVVTCFASANVIREAIRLGANFIIVHEPLFWSHEENIDDISESRILHAKMQLLDQGGIVVWRDHDHMHGQGRGSDRKNLDGMFDGIMRELGWEPYLLDSDLKPLTFKMPPTDATVLGRQLKENIGLNGIRIIGDPHTKVSKIFICEHIGSNDRFAADKILRTELEEFDALIPLEVIDWTLCAFVRDCCQLGTPKVIYNIGHFNFEELGMRYMAKYLPGLLNGSVPVHYVQSGDAFDFIL